MWLLGHRLNQATDAEVDPSGEAAAGSPISSGGETGAARVPEELTSHPDGIEWHG